jgi:hypothetical protein
MSHLGTFKTTGIGEAISLSLTHFQFKHVNKSRKNQVSDAVILPFTLQDFLFGSNTALCLTRILSFEVILVLHLTLQEF